MSIPAPRKNVLFGVTHELDGTPKIRIPRAVKIGIGLPAGKDVELYIDYNGTWVAEAPGLKDKESRVIDRVRYATRAEMQRAWPSIVAGAKERSYPKKINYFTFTKPGSIEYDPDFDAIEMHGPRPTEIDIVFVEPEPAHFAFEWWTSAKLNCFGDGVNANRLVTIAETPEEKAAAKEAQAAGRERYAVTQCFTRECRYAKKQCKPVGMLSFQLQKTPRLGSTAYFHTTSFRSVVNLSSNLEHFRMMTAAMSPSGEGFVTGIPLKLVLRRHKVTVNNKANTAYNVALEFHAESAVTMQRKLVESGLTYQKSISAPAKQIAAPASHNPSPSTPETVAEAVAAAAEPVVDDEEDFVDVSAEAITAELYPDDAEEFSEGGSGPETTHEAPFSREASEVLQEYLTELTQAKRSEAEVRALMARFQELVTTDRKKPEDALRICKAEDIASVEPAAGPKKAAPDPETIITQDQMLDMITVAKDNDLDQKGLQSVLRELGHADGSPATLPKAMFKTVMDWLQKPKEVRQPEPKKQRKFSL